MRDFHSVLAIDVGSTTTKALLFEPADGEFRLTVQGSVATTVEAPLEDVMIGVRGAVAALERATGRRLLAGDDLISPSRDGAGVDLFIATSSAGGGLQMAVTGLMSELTAQSAERAALGAGAIVIDVQAIDDGRQIIERIQRFRGLRPDMLLVAGGTDGGNVGHVLSMAEIIRDAKPTPRYGENYKVPVVYAGNSEAADQVTRTLSGVADVTACPNIRPVLETEVEEPAREAIHHLFLEHVMQHAPGYSKLVGWTGGRILPTPAAVGEILSLAAAQQRQNIVAVDIGGATTDVFSVTDGMFHRTVSANLGTSYSLTNVAAQAGMANVMRWLPVNLEESAVRNWLANKMVRPTTLSQTTTDLMIEQAASREALRLSLQHHRELIVGLKGIQIHRSIDEALDQEMNGGTKIDLLKIDTMIGSGGVLSHAPRRSQAMQMMIDGLQPEGVTTMFVDRVFMLPHLGILSRTDPELALDLLKRECLVALGTCIAPVGPTAEGQVMATVRYRVGQRLEQAQVIGGQLTVLPLPAGTTTEAEIHPSLAFDCGNGSGRVCRRTLIGGVCGIVLDGRGRPLNLPANDAKRLQVNRATYEALGTYPDASLGADRLERSEVSA